MQKNTKNAISYTLSLIILLNVFIVHNNFTGNLSTWIKIFLIVIATILVVPYPNSIKTKFRSLNGTWLSLFTMAVTMITIVFFINKPGFYIVHFKIQQEPLIFFWYLVLLILVLVILYIVIGLLFQKINIPNGKGILMATVVFTIMVLGMILLFKNGINQQLIKTSDKSAPKRAIRIESIISQGNIIYKYNDNFISDTLNIPRGWPVSLKLISIDTTYLLSIPKFKINLSVGINERDSIWFIADRTGEYRMYLKDNYGLRTDIKTDLLTTLEIDYYKTWEDSKNNPEVAINEFNEEIQILKSNNCFACHSIDGSKLVGPSFSGLYQKQQEVIDLSGTKQQVLVDEKYLKQAIIQPNENYPVGYSRGLMLSYQDKISEKELNDIIEYIKSLK